MSCSQPFAESLQARGFRMTPQRHAILHILRDSGGHLSPSEIYERARQTVPGMTEATVYRTLEFLVETNIVEMADRGNGHLAYELAGETHHHLVCRSCGAQLEVEDEALQSLIRQLEQQTGFRLNAGHLTFFGFCPECKVSR